jgi:beta-lactam-binding protein with PASTA domain
MLRPGQGLRLRLRLDPALAGIPWEYIYVRRAGGKRDSTGFLVLDPRVSIARHEAMPIPGDFDDTPKQRRLLVALASPEDEAPLDLDKERDNLKAALRDVPGIGLDFLENATIQTLGDELVPGADIFHFAGHGTFGQAGLEARYRTAEGEGAILLVAEDGSGAPMPAEELAVNLRGRGVELVVLGACQTGRRGEGNIWSGVAAALMKAGIPAAVAMQYGIWDDAAIAFNRSFYRVLAAGLPLDYAVSAGRLAAFNRCHPVREDRELGRCWRDWGVPVLYLRSDQDFVLPAIEDADQREAVTRKAKAEAERRERELAEKGIPAPALTGKSFSEAEDLGREAGVAVRAADRRYHSSVPVNAVIEQSPEAGTPVNAGAVIEVVLSKGPEIAPVVVPDVTGKTLEQAEAKRRELEMAAYQKGIPAPALKGKTLKQAEATVEALGLSLKSLKIEGRRYDAAAPAETVIQQRPWPGETIKPGATVSLVVSRGPKPARAGPIIKRPLVFSALAAAVVLAILALAGVFSTTPKVRVPSVEGPEESVTRELREMGFEVESEPGESKEVPGGHVIRTHPAAGEESTKGSVIKLYISTGPPEVELVEVPPAEGPEESAARKLIAMGFKVEYKAVPSEEVPEGHVIRTEPAAGDEVAEGSVIRLVVSGAPPPEDAGVYINEGLALDKLGKYKAAVASYDQAIKIDPANAKAHYLKGNALYTMEQYKAAASSYDQAIKIDPANAWVHYGKGDALFMSGEYEEAIKSCDTAIELSPGYAMAYYIKGNALNWLGRYYKAIESYDRAIKINPKYANVYYYKGVALQKIGRTEEADEYYKIYYGLTESGDTQE